MVGTVALCAEGRRPWHRLRPLPPLLPPLLSSDSCECLSLPCFIYISCSQPWPASGPCTPSTPEFRVPRGSLHSLHSEFHIPLGFCKPSIRCPSLPPLHAVPSEFHVSRDLGTRFAQNSVSLEAFKHTLHSKLQAPDTRWAPDSIQEGFRGTYLTAWPLGFLLTLPYHPETPAQLSSVMPFFGHKPYSGYQPGGGDSVFPCLVQCPVSSFPAHSQSL